MLKKQLERWDKRGVAASVFIVQDCSPTDIKASAIYPFLDTLVTMGL